MTKPIEQYTVDELSTKIQAIKAERERTANALKRYEEELERRNREAPLGVPLESSLFAGILGTYYFGFVSNKEKKVFDGLLKDYVEALQDIANGSPIDIKVLLPLLKKGWVAMDKNGDWYWYKVKPIQGLVKWTTEKPASYLTVFNLKPAKNWETSLMECGL